MAAEYQLLREMIPGPLPSKEADKLMLDSLEAVAREIGTERFHGVILKAIETCERRPTLATLRRIAGLNARLGPQEEALAKAWEIVTVVVTRFLGADGEGNTFVRPRVAQKDGEYFEEMPPYIPLSVIRSVQAMGGWKSLRESYPQWHAQRFGTFKELLNLSPEDMSRLLEPKSTVLTNT